MGSHKDLFDKDGIEKLKELVKSAGMCMFATQLDKYPLSARPMSTQDVDDAGNLWFFSQASSDKNEEIEVDDRVQLFYGNTSSSEYLSIAGRATVSRDKQKAKELWTGWAKTWFTEGVDDPELTIIKVQPEDVHYWDTKNNKTVSLLKIMAGAVLGKTMDDGVEGTINV